MKQGRSLQELGQELERQRQARKDFIADTRNLEMMTNQGGTRLSCFLSSKNPHFHQDNSPSSSWGNPHFQRGHQDADFIAASCRMSACSIR